MNLGWLGPLVVAGLSAAGCTFLGRALQRERARLRLARAEVRQARSRLSRGRPAPPVP